MRSGKNYRHFSGIVFDDEATGFSLYEKNMILINAIIDIFGLANGKDVREVKNKVSRDHVGELYKLMAWLWPPDTPVSEYLPKPSPNLRALYMGNMRPQTILRSVGRYSLYCDEILVMNPFLNPWFIAPDYNPIIHPEDYVGETWKWVLFTLQLAPWIQDQQVIFLPNPLDFDSKLRTSMWKSAEERLQDKDLTVLLKEDDFLESDMEEFMRSFMSMPDYAIRQKIKEFDPKMTDEEVEEMMKYVGGKKNSDPYFVNNPNEKGAFGIKTYQTGGSLEQGMYISQLTGAHLYTDFKFRWREILSSEKGSSNESPWSPISYGMQNLNFKFLDNVDLNFIHNIKSENRLSSLRKFFRDTWRNVSKDENISYEQANKKALEFCDELKDQFANAESEWDSIDADLQRWFMGRGGLGALLATGGIDWKIPAAGFVLSGVNSLLDSRHKRKAFRKNVPLSVFVDLAKDSK